MPPLSVRPPTPVSEIRPPGVASPWAWVAAIDVAPGGPALDPGTAPLGIDPHAAHRRQVDHHGRRRRRRDRRRCGHRRGSRPAAAARARTSTAATTSAASAGTDDDGRVVGRSWRSRRRARRRSPASSGVRTSPRIAPRSASIAPTSVTWVSITGLRSWPPPLRPAPVCRIVCHASRVRSPRIGAKVTVRHRDQRPADHRPARRARDLAVRPLRAVRRPAVGRRRLPGHDHREAGRRAARRPDRGRATREPFRCFGDVLVEPHAAIADLAARRCRDRLRHVHARSTRRRRDRYPREIDWLRRMHAGGVADRVGVHRAR